MKRPLFYLAIAAAVLVLALNIVLYRMAPNVKIGAIRPPSELLSLPPKTVQTAGNAAAGSPCQRAYQKFYPGGLVKIRIAFGYKDSRPSRFVGDRYEKLMLLHYLTSPCEEGNFACGFKRNVQDPDLLTKDKVEIRVTHSSVGPDDELNRVDPLQEVQSALSESNFLEGLHEANVVFYNGHSRDGGGPDFEPPKLAPHGLVNYDWYLRHRPGETKLLESLRGLGNDRPRPLLGLFSCRSGDHFLAKMEKVGKLPSITSPRLYFYTDALRSMLEALNAVIGRYCEKDFNDVLNPKDSFGRARLKSFFENG